MQIGVVFPQREIGRDPAAIATYARTVERLGYRHVLVYEHVLGEAASPGRPATPYDAGAAYHEPFVLFGFLAALTELELATAVLVLPQRQTALVAKQAAQVDVLSGGRLRLGVGVGWNRIEYDVLGMDFATRGRRIDAQVAQLRRLWSEDLVTVDLGNGEHGLVAISPQPVQRPIPLWMGGGSQAACRRIGRLADGWFPQVQPGPALDEARTRVEEAASAAGRDFAMIGMEGRLTWAGDLAGIVAGALAWKEAGATHLAVDTMGSGLTSDDHLMVLRDVAQSLRTQGLHTM